MRGEDLTKIYRAFRDFCLIYKLESYRDKKIPRQAISKKEACSWRKRITSGHILTVSSSHFWKVLLIFCFIYIYHASITA